MNERRRIISTRAGVILPPEQYDFTDYDALIEETQGIDTFCSSSTWSESARKAFMPDSPLVVFEHGEGRAVFAHENTPDRQRMLLPLDATWTLGSSVAAPNPQRDIPAIMEMIDADRPFYDFIMFSGMRPGSPIHRMVYHEITKRGVHAVNFKPADRAVAEIGDGADAWLQRRSTKFRASIRGALRKAEEAGIQYTILPPDTPPDELLRGFVDLEKRSWKGLSGTGIIERSMASFCQNVLAHTTPAGQTRTIIATHRDELVGFIFGAVSNGRYRGIQMSVDHRYRRIGLGNALQVQMIQALAAENVTVYDLGSSMPYKDRWADRTDRTVSILIGPMRHR